MDYLRKRMTYANVMSTVAAFVAVCGTTAYVAEHVDASPTRTVRVVRGEVTPGHPERFYAR